MADQRLFNHLAARRVFEVIGAEFIILHLDILIVDAGSIEVGDRLPFQFVQAIQRNADLTLSTGG